MAARGNAPAGRLIVTALLDMLNHLLAAWTAGRSAGPLRRIRFDDSGFRLELELDTPWAKGETIVRGEAALGADGRMTLILTVEQPPAAVDPQWAPFRELLANGRITIETERTKA
jgi:hypothetical protein